MESATGSVKAGGAGCAGGAGEEGEALCDREAVGDGRVGVGDGVTEGVLEAGSGGQIHFDEAAGFAPGEVPPSASREQPGACTIVLMGGPVHELVL